MDYTREEIEVMYPEWTEWVIQVIITERYGEGRMKGQPIIEIEANREIMNTNLYLDRERFQIRMKKE